MKCSDVINATGWSCSPLENNALLVHAPLTLGDDGQLASFYLLNDSPTTFYLTDAHAAIMHVLDHGASVTPSRLKKVASQTPSLRFAQIAERGHRVVDSAERLEPEG